MRALDTGLKSRDGRIYRPREKACNGAVIESIIRDRLSNKPRKRGRPLAADACERWTVRLETELGIAGMVK